MNTYFSKWGFDWVRGNRVPFLHDHCNSLMLLLCMLYAIERIFLIIVIKKKEKKSQLLIWFDKSSYLLNKNVMDLVFLNLQVNSSW
jgi:hypothetical protein